jgi:hypothetical protein
MLAQRWCVWCGLVLLVAFGVGFVVAGFLPPPRPTDSAEQVAQMYREHAGRIRVGMLIVLAAAPFVLPWTTVISLQLLRIEGRLTPWPVVQFGAGALGIAFFLAPETAWLVAAYRPSTRSAEALQQLNDLGWLPFVGIASLVMMQNLSIALAILADRRARPVFPRWVGYFNLWTVVLLAPGFCDFFFFAGPLAWNGVFAFWVPAGAFVSWFGVMFVALRRAISQQESERDPEHSAGELPVSGSARSR